MSASGRDEPKNQTFHGPGSVGGDNNGIINNNVLLDPKTAAVMKDLNRKAPELAALLRKALRDGFISPDAVLALNRAVDHLNEDTAEAFNFAARHINEETAISFQAVAQDFIDADQQLRTRVSEINTASEKLRDTVDQINGAQKPNASDGQLQRSSIAENANRGPVRSAYNWLLILQLMSFCLGVGLLATAILAHYHLVGDAQRIGAFAAGIPLVAWAVKAVQHAPSKRDRLSPSRPTR